MAKKKRRPKIPHPMDVALGNRIREVRKQAHVSMQELGMECGVKVGQIAKYETGADRVSFSRLTEIAKALDTTVMDLIAPLFHDPAMNQFPPK